MMKGAFLPGAALIAAGWALPAAAADDPPPRPKEIDALYACQAIADAGQRLACFDQAVRTIQSADSAGEVIFADREQVKKAKRGLFGLGDIRLGIFSRSKDDPEDQELQEIEAGVRSITQGRDGKLQIVLDDGARWAQTDLSRLRLKVMQSKKVTIKRGPLGSYVMVFDNGSSVKVKRVL
ncbi:MAG: hypothetical protein ACEQR8_06535 [Cypionkella sp.]